MILTFLAINVFHNIPTPIGVAIIPTTQQYASFAANQHVTFFCCKKF
jgi:hypothetical protein